MQAQCVPTEGARPGAQAQLAAHKAVARVWRVRVGLGVWSPWTPWSGVLWSCHMSTEDRPLPPCTLQPISIKISPHTRAHCTGTVASFAVTRNKGDAHATRAKGGERKRSGSVQRGRARRLHSQASQVPTTSPSVGLGACSNAFSPNRFAKRCKTFRRIGTRSTQSTVNAPTVWLTYPLPPPLRSPHTRDASRHL